MTARKIPREQDRVKRILRDQMDTAAMTNGQLAKLLNQRGLKESAASIRNKLSRGTFSAAFFVEALDSMGARDVFLGGGVAVPILREGEVQQVMSLTDTAERLPLTNIHQNQRTLQRWISQQSQSTSSPRFPNKVISLFSGAGGLDIGLELAGFETSVCVEIDADCRATMRANRPEWKLIEDAREGRTPGDIKAVRAAEILELAKLDIGQAGLVVGGAPCQAFSNIGKREGVTDIDNGGDLFAHFVRIVKGVMPHAFIFENVAGITQRKHSEVISYMRAQFQGLGYGLSGAILNAANYGVPQKRERFILIGLRGVGSPALPLPNHCKDLAAWRQFIADLSPFVDEKPEPWQTVGDAFKAIPRSLKTRHDYALMNISEVVQNRMKLIGPGQNFHVLPMSMRPQCWQSGKHQGADTFGRLRLDQPSVTVRTAAYNPAKGRYIHPTENRGLSSHEMASLQGFPVDWQFYSAKYERVPLVSVGKQIGNAVPPLLAQALGIAIRQQLHLCSEY